MKKIGNKLWGIVLIIIGLIIAGNRTGIVHIEMFFDGWWTLFIIVPCFINLFTDEDKTGSIIGLLIGVALLLGCQGYLDFDIIWKLAFPAILVIIGLSIIFKDTLNGKVNSKIKDLNKDNKGLAEYAATFSGQDISLDKEEFKGANLNAIFGGLKLDLRNSIINSDVIINATSVFGGIDIFVPSNVIVKTKSTSIFGGVSKKVENKTEENNYTIYVNGTALFGGVEIK